MISVGAMLLARRVSLEDPRGIWEMYDAVMPESFPTSMPLGYLWCRLEFSPDEMGAHNIEVVMNDPQGCRVCTISQSQLPIPLTANAHGYHDYAFQIENQPVRLEAPGEYEISMSIDGQPKRSIYLPVISAGS